VLRSDPFDLPDVDVRAAGDGRTVLLDIGQDQVISASPSPHLLVDDSLRRFLRLIGAVLAQAADRVQTREAERQVVALERQMSESLQRSLLTDPVRVDGLQVAVRYHAAAEQAHIGGDWYDAFLLPDRQLALAVGDVAGHDHRAAAAMAQIRNLLRGVAYTVDGTPALVLRSLDAAMRGLAVGTFASAVLARVELTAAGGRMLRWSNAGHPCPLLLRPDGSVSLLQTPADQLLGISGRPAAGTTRSSSSRTPA
jgi:serine phosphatase RsbU (regulator of sigma subunit)